MKHLGIEFPIAILTGLAAIVQAAMRTGYKFFELASKQGMGVASWLDGASAMLGVEGFVAVVGLNATVITNIAHDHHEHLGSGLLQIAAEKAAKHATAAIIILPATLTA